MANLGAEIDVEMNVQDLCGYNKFQYRLGERMTLPQEGRTVPKYVRNIKILDSYDNTLVTASLYDNTNRTTLAIRKKDCWVVGFRNRRGQWFEFEDKTGHLIRNSIKLDTKGNYRKLNKHCADTALDKVPIGRRIMSKYVRVLANFEVKEGDDVAKVTHDVAEALIACIIFVAEGARFRPIAEAIHHCMCDNGDGTPFTLENCKLNDDLKKLGWDAEKLIKNWSSFSKALLKYEANTQANDGDQTAEACVDDWKRLQLAVATLKLVLYS